MYDAQQYKNLQNKSHVRGLLSKEFYSLEQSELERKRKEMKEILDQQVEERRKMKEKQKLQENSKMRVQEDEIKKYYVSLEDRRKEERQREERREREKAQILERHANGNGFSNSIQNPTFREQVELTSNETFPRQRSRIRSKANRNEQYNYNHSHNNVDYSNIPVMPVMDVPSNYNYNSSFAQNVHQGGQSNNNSSSNRSHNHNQNNSGNYQNVQGSPSNSGNNGSGHYGQQSRHNQNHQNQPNYEQPSLLTVNHRNSSSSGNIPLLDLNEDSYNRQNKNNGSKRAKQHVNSQSNSPPKNFFNGGNQSNHNVMSQSRKYNENQINVLAPEEEYNGGSRRNTENNKESIVSLNNNQNYQEMMAFSRNNQGSPELQEENMVLKSQLKKSQQAISLLIGAVRSNNRFDKFRVQAEKILHGHPQSQNNIIGSNSPENQRESRVLSGGVERKNSSEASLMFPKLNLRHQSIMHDYILGAARKASKGKANREIEKDRNRTGFNNGKLGAGKNNGKKNYEL